MANYLSQFSGLHNDQYNNRIQAFENIITLSPPESIEVKDKIIANRFSSKADASTDITIIPTDTDNSIALETGNGNGSISSWLWHEKWSSANYGIFHDNTNDILRIVENSNAKIDISLTDAGPVKINGMTQISNPNSVSNYDENLRLHMSKQGWVTIALCGSENTSNLGTSANTWTIHNNSGNFYITKNGSNANIPRFQNVNNIWSFSNLSKSDYNYNGAALQIREYNWSGANPSEDTWGVAPRLAWHWGGRCTSQIGLASNGYLYESPLTNSTFYRIAIETGSSRTIKENINQLPLMGEQIDKLQPVSFNYNYDRKAGIRYGLIWEDTVKILPDICKEDKNQNGGKIINYIDLISVLIKEIQDLRKRISKLENKII